MNIPTFLGTFCALALPLSAAQEKAVNFVPARADPRVGDWQGGGYVAQVFLTAEGKYSANVFRKFDAPDDKPVAVLSGTATGDTIAFSGDGWSGVIATGHFKASKDGESFDLKHVTRTPPTLGAPPPKGAVVLFDGRNLDAWLKKKAKDWLSEDGPAQWKLVEGGAMEVMPGTDCIVTKQKFGDCQIHVEFRTLGGPSNSGVYLQTRYEVNINETYGRLDGTPNAGFDNCTPPTAHPRMRATRPPLEWQTFDIDFRAPQFDASSRKTANARATILFNGVKIYDQQELNPPTGAAGRLGEAPTGPLMLQEHGMPVQFRNIWLVEKAKP